MAMTKPSYDLHQELVTLSAHIMAYNAWFASVLQLVFYPPTSASNMAPALPDLLIPSLTTVEGLLSPEDRALLDKAYRALQADADGLCAAPPERGRFKKFTTQYGEFVRDLHAISQNRILEIWGLDVLTGLKNKNAMLEDMKQELERLARHGRAFSLALVQIDHYEVMRARLPQAEREAIIKSVTAMIRSCLRSFDGAYYIGEGEFVLSLKQATAAGGQKALERLRQKLEKTDLSFACEGRARGVSLSCCVAEPLPEDNIEQVLSNLRNDLQGRDRDDGSVLVYYEISPLQRFVNSKNKP
jgi:diguanylate cyclase (GGDEF)-like protein